MFEMEGDVACRPPDSAAVIQVVKVLRSRLRRRGLAISISGIDGSGKTTLAKNLVRALDASDVPVRYLHVHQWYLNVLTIPMLLLFNRYFARKTLVFDRSIYDNIAVMSVRRRCPPWLSWVMLAAVRGCYPRFDYRFYLVVSFDEARVRRPDTRKVRFSILSRVYDEIALRVQYIRLPSDSSLFAAVIRNIAVEA